ncbi:MAG TPA: hypothetical protein VNO14_00945, partial [Blastocatellia bacterium]|nr:hypothetical protein [Blastocatellia bacterium]
GADLRGCNLTGARLFGIKSDGIKLDDAWAEWVNLSPDPKAEDRALLEEVFANIVGKPMAQLMVEGRVSDSVWAVILSHLCAFQAAHPQSSDVRLKAIQHGMNSSAIYLEADREMSLAAYFAEFADIMGKGSAELIGRLAPAVMDQSERETLPKESLPAPLLRFFDRESSEQPLNLEDPLGLRITSHIEALQNTAFWTSEKAIAILSPDRRIWLESASSDSLTLRPPHGSTVGLDLVRGRFVTK